MTIEFRKKNGSFIRFAIASESVTSDELKQMSGGIAPSALNVTSVIKGGHEKSWWQHAVTPFSK